MKIEPSIASRSLRAVGLAITLVSMVTFSTVIYTAWVDYENLVTELKGGNGSLISGSAVLQGSTLLLELNVTAQNSGLYPVSITLSCSPGQPDGAICPPSQTTVPPGGESTLHFRMSIPNGTEYVLGSKPLHINGSVTLGLEPFASFSLARDFGTVFSFGGS